MAETILIEFEQQSASALEKAGQAMERAAKAMERAAGAAQGWGGAGNPFAAFNNPGGGPAWPGSVGWPGAAGGRDWTTWGSSDLAGRSRMPEPGGGGGAGAKDAATGWTKLAAEFYLVQQALGMLTTGIKNVAGMFEALNDSTATTRQRFNNLADSVPVLGSITSSVRSLFDGIRGTTNALRVQEQRAGVMTEQGQVEMQAIQTRHRLEVGSAGHFARGDYWLDRQRRGFGAYGIADPANVMDPYQKQFFAAQLGIGQARERTGADLAANKAEMGQLQKQEQELLAKEQKETLMYGLAQSREKKARRRADAEFSSLGGQLGSWFGGNPKVDIDAAARDSLEALNRLEQTRTQLIETRQQMQAKAVENQQKEAENARHDLDLEKSKLEVLRQQGDVARGTAHAFGRMLPGEKRMILSAIGQANTKGFGSLLPFQMDLIARGGPATQNWLQRNWERQAEKDPYQAELRGLLGADANMPQSLQANEQAQLGAMKNIDQLSKNLEARMTTSIGDAFDRMVDKILEVVERKIQDAGNRARSGNVVANNGRNS